MARRPARKPTRKATRRRRSPRPRRPRTVGTTKLVYQLSGTLDPPSAPPSDPSAPMDAAAVMARINARSMAADARLMDGLRQEWQTEQVTAAIRGKPPETWAAFRIRRLMGGQPLMPLAPKEKPRQTRDPRGRRPRISEAQWRAHRAAHPEISSNVKGAAVLSDELGIELDRYAYRRLRERFKDSTAP